MSLLANRICLVFVILVHSLHAQNLSSHEVNTNTSDSLVFVSSTLLTKFHTTNNNNSTKYVNTPKIMQKNYLNDIFQKLEQAKASKCEYGNNPKIAEICSNFTQTVSVIFFHFKYDP